MSKILVPVDGTQAALGGVRHAMRVAAADKDAMIYLVNVQPALNRHITQFVSRRAVEEARQARGQTALADARDLLSARGVAYRYAVLRGEPSQAIARFAADERVDHIIIGERRKRPFERWVTGSFTNRLLARAAAPVEIVQVDTSAKLARWAVPIAGLGLAAALIVAE